MASKEQRLRLAFFAGRLAVATVGVVAAGAPDLPASGGGQPGRPDRSPTARIRGSFAVGEDKSGVAACGAANLLTPKEGIAAALAALDKQYGYAGALSWEAGKALVAQREKAATNLVAELAKLGPGGAASMGAAYRQEDNLRDKALLVRALAMVNDDQAAATLQELLNSEPISTACSAILSRLPAIERTAHPPRFWAGYSTLLTTSSCDIWRRLLCKGGRMRCQYWKTISALKPVWMCNRHR